MVVTAKKPLEHKPVRSLEEIARELEGIFL